MSASFLLAGVGLAGSGCRRPRGEDRAVRQDAGELCARRAAVLCDGDADAGSAIPLVAKSNDGRPTKIEGNALHPDSNGGTDRFAQASMLNLYDPDRAQRFTRAGRTCRRSAAMDS